MAIRDRVLCMTVTGGFVAAIGEGDEVVLAVGAGARTQRDVEFTAFMVDAQPALARTAWLLCGDVHRAEELVQHALVRTYVAWPRAREGDPIAYARRVLANARIDHWRKHRRELLTEPHEVPARERASVEGSHAERDALVRALVQLSPQRRRVVVLRYLLDLPERQVADELGLSLGAVKSAASRGLAHLRRILADETTTIGHLKGER
ncbi:SigE family RNA polymerase sigma factor [Cellulosimicrobium cellulans]|uniref:SigE family RNA polymerase sigma factor n=1 Tax=Cellulosimicrobium cellulans TaxID=1710 RepID=UPI0038164DC5